jgi:hypothetical protein
MGFACGSTHLMLLPGFCLDISMNETPPWTIGCLSPAIRMSGRKHHYLPRFLQRPFAFRQKGKQFYVYAHHRAHGTFPKNVMELGQELDFYGGPDDTALDDAITDGEKQLAVTVHRLNNGEVVPQDDIARLISALSIRTKAMRQALTDLFPKFLEAGRARILNEKQIRRQFCESLKNPAKQRELIDEQIRKRQPKLNREERGKMSALMLPRWKSYVTSHQEQFVHELREMTTRLFDHALTEAASMADNAFLDALARGPEMPRRAERFAEVMQFNVWEADEGQFFVLGDCGPVGLFTDGVPRLALGSMNDDVQMDYVFLPVSPIRCIVGRRSSNAHGLNVADLNKISASLSHEFLISNLQEEEPLVELCVLIGTLTPIETEEGIFRALNDDQEEAV